MRKTNTNVPANLRVRNRDRGDKIFYWLLLALPMLQIAVFYFGVNFQSILMAFQRKQGDSYVFDPGNNWNQFVDWVTTESSTMNGFWTNVVNSLEVWIFTSLAGTILAVIFAYYIYHRRFASNFFKVMLFIPSVLPAIMMVSIYKNFLNQGLPAFLTYLCETDVPEYLKSIMPGVFNDKPAGDLRLNLITLFTVWVSFGPQVLVYTGAMDRVDPSMLEAARLDGANSFQEFFKVILPNIASTISTFLTIGVASIFTNQNNLFSFMSINPDPSEENMGYYLYRYTLQNQEGDLTYAAFLGLVFTLIVIPLAFGVRKLFDRSDD